MKKYIRFLIVAAIVPLLVSSCGKIKQAKNMIETVSTFAETGTAGSDGDSAEKWENIDLTEKDIRRFYTAVSHLNKKYTDIDFEIAMIAALSAMSEGLNIEKAVKEETDLTFEEYNGLSVAILLSQTEGSVVDMTMAMITSMEESLAVYDNNDKTNMTDDEQEAYEELRINIAETKAEINSAEFQKQLNQSTMILKIREEMGL
jgi:hypothetical protein